MASVYQALPTDPRTVLHPVGHSGVSDVHDHSVAASATGDETTEAYHTPQSFHASNSLGPVLPEGVLSGVYPPPAPYPPVESASVPQPAPQYLAPKEALLLSPAYAALYPQQQVFPTHWDTCGGRLSFASTAPSEGLGFLLPQQASFASDGSVFQPQELSPPYLQHQTSNASSYLVPPYLFSNSSMTIKSEVDAGETSDDSDESYVLSTVSGDAQSLAKRAKRNRNLKPASVKGFGSAQVVEASEYSIRRKGGLSPVRPSTSSLKRAIAAIFSDRVQVFASVSDAARQLDIRRSNIQSCLRGTSRSAKGFAFSTVDDPSIQNLPRAKFVVTLKKQAAGRPLRHVQVFADDEQVSSAPPTRFMPGQSTGLSPGGYSMSQVVFDANGVPLGDLSMQQATAFVPVVGGSTWNAPNISEGFSTVFQQTTPFDGFSNASSFYPTLNAEALALSQQGFSFSPSSESHSVSPESPTQLSPRSSNADANALVLPEAAVSNVAVFGSNDSSPTLSYAVHSQASSQIGSPFELSPLPAREDGAVQYDQNNGLVGGGDLVSAGNSATLLGDSDHLMKGESMDQSSFEALNRVGGQRSEHEQQLMTLTSFGKPEFSYGGGVLSL